uniref:Uncharacterized protein n=1 Tax=Euplotes harpa TaxID=151035 RepID=A0A7S3JIW2_9SPIT|mmetsp:Transcript_39111/g.44763  ORF Transcript_39111/g.44763 Transcript_39111/m.44763 type:complete len:141 (+) Transcript_39111:627-1049(+)
MKLVKNYTTDNLKQLSQTLASKGPSQAVIRFQNAEKQIKIQLYMKKLLEDAIETSRTNEASSNTIDKINYIQDLSELVKPCETIEHETSEFTMKGLKQTTLVDNIFTKIPVMSKPKSKPSDLSLIDKEIDQLSKELRSHN